jgi:REP element-mobilizing transposase RayT
MIGYMITWTTYGSWVQGDKRGFVKRGKILDGNAGLERANKSIQKYEKVKLTHGQRKVVEECILKSAHEIGQKVCAIAVCSNHVHVVAECCKKSIEAAASLYKTKSMAAVCRQYAIKQRIWSTGFDKRFCFSREDLDHKIAYVNKHNK